MTKRARFRVHRDTAGRRQSAITAIKALLPLDLYPAHKRELLSICLWKLTQAEGPSKYKTRYRTEASLLAERNQLQHEHVWRRKTMVANLLAQPDQVEEIILAAVGCVVTREEHKRLSAVDREFPDLDGWERYSQAGLVVRDMESGQTLDWSVLCA